MAKGKKIKGTDGNDLSLNGTGKNDWILGFKGNDYLLGKRGNDILEGHKGSDDLDGGKDHDRLFGGDDNDFLRGGSGNDFLKGGAGADTFVFDVMPGGRNADRIADFTVDVDTIRFQGAVYTAFHVDGEVQASDLFIGKVSDADGQHLIYNPRSGKLFYDADGAGEDDAVLIAKLQRGLDLSSDDFSVI